MPYPCSGPSVSSVLRIISANVPCQTSIRFFICDAHTSVSRLLCERNRNRTVLDRLNWPDHQGGAKGAETRRESARGRAALSDAGPEARRTTTPLCVFVFSVS